MFIYNFKLNGSKFFKIIFGLILTILVIILFIAIFRIFSTAKDSNKSTCISNDVSTISSSNYTNILKTVHDNIDNYIGVKIKFTGYIYRIYDFNENQFVLARDMIVSSDFKTVVVGFLCEYKYAKNFDDNTWVELTGTIKKGDYHGDMPIVHVTQINEIKKPSEEYVYPPSEDYIPTNGIL